MNLSVYSPPAQALNSCIQRGEKENKTEEMEALGTSCLDWVYVWQLAWISGSAKVRVSLQQQVLLRASLGLGHQCQLSAGHDTKQAANARCPLSAWRGLLRWDGREKLS